MLRAAAALPLTGRYGPLARQSELGLRAWAAADGGVELTVRDCGEDLDRAAAVTRELAETVDILFGPYGSGATRAVARAFAGEPNVIWNHGGTAVPRTGARIVDIVGPAETYWTGLAAVLRAASVPTDRVAVLHAESGFGRAVAAGAVGSLRDAGRAPLILEAFDADSAVAAAERALAAGARAVVGCGRFEDDIALAAALEGSGAAVGLVALGVQAALDALGDGVLGGFGPCAWLAGEAVPPAPLGPRADYPAAQALAAGIVARAAIRGLDPRDHDAVWDAVRGLASETLLGRFAIDHDGRQVGHRPVIVRWEPAAAGPARRVAWRPER